MTKKMKKHVCLFLVLCMTFGLLTSYGTHAVAENAQSVTIEALLAANLPEAVFSNHQSMLCSIHDLLDGDWSFYCEPGLYYESDCSGWSRLLDSDGSWYLQEEEDGKPTLSRIWYVMNDEERETVEVHPEDLSTILNTDTTMTEKIEDIRDNENETLTVTTRINAEDARILLEDRGLADAKEYRDAEWEVVYLVAADTLEIQNFAEYCVVGEERNLISSAEIIYDMKLPEAAAEFQAIREEYLTSGAEDTKTITATYKALTPEEESFSLTVPRKIRVRMVFRDGYGTIYTDPEGIISYDGTPDADGNFRLYIFAEE